MHTRWILSCLAVAACAFAWPSGPAAAADSGKGISWAPPPLVDVADARELRPFSRSVTLAAYDEEVVLASADGFEDRIFSPGRLAPGWGLVGGAETTFLVPNLNGHPVSVELFDLTGGAPTTVQSTTADVDDMYFAPRVWLGARHGCWGIAGRFWYMNDAERAFDPVILPDDVFGFTAQSRLKAYTVDLEVTRDWCVLGCQTQLGFGARYASLESSRSVFASGAVTPTALFGSAMSARQTDGSGITFSWTGTHGLGRHFPNLSLYWALRGSVLWGDATASAQTMAAADDGVGAGAGGHYALAGTNGTLYIGEVQLGVQWEHPLECVRARAFLRIAGEYQYWDSDAWLGAGAQTTSFAGPGLAQATAEARGLRMGLAGFTLGAGLTW